MTEKLKEIPLEHHHRKMLPVWLFIGVLLLLYGVIILWTSLGEYAHPAPVVLARYHAGLWGGILLIVLGGFYTIKFWPRAPAKKG